MCSRNSEATGEIRVAKSASDNFDFVRLSRTEPASASSDRFTNDGSGNELNSGTKLTQTSYQSGRQSRGGEISGSGVFWIFRQFGALQGRIWHEIAAWTYGELSAFYSSACAAFGQTYIFIESPEIVLSYGQPSAFIPSRFNAAKISIEKKGGFSESLTQKTKSLPDSTNPGMASRFKIDRGLNETSQPSSDNAFLRSSPKVIEPGSLSNAIISIWPFGTLRRRKAISSFAFLLTVLTFVFSTSASTCFSSSSLPASAFSRSVLAFSNSSVALVVASLACSDALPPSDSPHERIQQKV